MDSTGPVAAQLSTRLAVLGAVSTVCGLSLAGATTRPAVRAFGVQTACWGVVDLAIAGYSSSRWSRPPEAGRLRRLLVVNACLDVGYVLAGAHLAARRPSLGGRLVPAAAVGHGLAVVVQGVSLFVLDVAHARALGPAGR